MLPVKKLVEKNRSYRRFQQSVKIKAEFLHELVDLARLSPSAQNLQPLKFILSTEDSRNRKIFPTLSWAGYLKDWTGPKEGERPSAYIIILGDTRISSKFGCDHGIAAQSILVGAVERELGGCIIQSIERQQLRAALKIPEYFEILMVIALGKPAETVQIDSLSDDGSIKYWRDEKEVHHVPKRSLNDLIID